MDEKRLLKKLGRHVAQLRQAKGYTQEQVCLEAGFSQGAVSKIESGRVNPQILTLIKLADAIGVSLAELLDFRRQSD